MGKGLANPIGTFWSVVMLLEHLGEMSAAERVMTAIEQVTTAQVTQAVCELLSASAQRKAA